MNRESRTDMDELTEKQQKLKEALNNEQANHSDDSNDEIFEDASISDEIETVDLQTSFNNCEAAINLFFNNNVAGAVELMTPWAGTSLYHSLGIAIFEFIPAVLTFEPNQIQRAIAAIKTCVSICNKNRRHYSFVETIGSIVKKPNYSTFSDMEAHAELCYAEALLLQAALTIIEGEDLAGFIKGTYKVKTCYNTYYHCLDMEQQKTWESENSRDNFTSGVRLGIATFNLMISMLPPKFIAFLEFVGFSGNRLPQGQGNHGSRESATILKDLGLSELEIGSESPGMRSVLCSMMLLVYHLVMCPFAGGEGDYNVCDRVLQRTLKVYPHSVWFLVFKARFQFLKGNLEDAISIYKLTSAAEGGFRQFQNLCYWELMWLHALIVDYQQAAYYADLLLQQSRWSKTTHSYMKAAMLIQSKHDPKDVDTTVVKCLLSDAESFKLRIAGKSLPMEKFILRRCARYNAQRCRLILPEYELICIWNLLPVLKMNRRDVLQNMLKVIENTRLDVTSDPKDWMGPYVADNLALIDYLHGCTLAAMGMPRLAIEKFNDALKWKKDIKEDSFIMPYTVCDMAMCYFELEDYQKSLELLSQAKKKHSGYSLESRLHFRVHSRTQMVKQHMMERNL